MILFLDFETTFQRDEKRRTDPSPYNPANYLVSAGIDTDDLIPSNEYYFFSHTNCAPTKLAKGRLQSFLDNATLLVAHNAKFELAWLRAAGFVYSGPIADTMIREYILSKGRKLSVSLEASCERHGVTHKKKELVDAYLKQGIGLEAIPWEIVQEYGEGDVQSLKELYYSQLDLLDGPEKHLWPTVNLMEEFCSTLSSIEDNGIAIDIPELDRLEKEFNEELVELKADLQKIVYQVMGDTPINLDSPQQLSELIYSRKVIDKDAWKRIFNLGSEIRGSVLKPKYKPRMKTREFVDYVKLYTLPLYKTVAEHCISCDNKGSIQRYRVDGITPYVRRSICASCNGSGYVFKSLNEIAGLRFVPNGPEDVAAGGFSTDKTTLDRLAHNANGIAKEFVEKSRRINAVSNYIDTVIAGIRRGIRQGNILHTSFMQCVTATGRLSSRDPNFQNLPRANTFPVRKAIISRFKGGTILSGDFKTLEFRVAGELSGDKQIFSDIINNIDIHTETSKVISLNRQDSKPHTFAPVYGAVAHGKAENIGKYYNFFMDKYKGLSEWHTTMGEEILNNGGYYRLPSGREYHYENVKRKFNGQITNSTIFKNYPVQGFATADLAVIACVKAQSLFVLNKLQSLIILTVHDDITADIFPGEEEIAAKLLAQAMSCLKEECIRRYKYELKMPIDAEYKIGPNWLEQKEFHNDM